MRRVDVVVVGAGAMGAATAWQLARRGRDVLLVERFGAGHRNGSSHGGVRIFRHAYDDPLDVRWTVEAARRWAEAEADTGETLLERTGAYDHGPRAAIEPIVAALTAVGVDHERLAPDAAAERVPGLRFDEAVVHHPGGGRCFANRTVAALTRRTAELGGDVRFDVTARLRRTGDAVEVDVGDEVVAAPVAVVTAGAWVRDVLAGTGAEVALPPLTITQEQVLHFEPHDPTATWPSFIHHADPLRYGLHTPGEGLKVGGHHEGDVTDPDPAARTFALDAGRLDAVRDYVATWVPGVDPTPQHGATCLYTTTPDERFVVDRVGPIVVGSPCSGHGFKFTPLVGELLADLADGAAPSPLLASGRYRLAAQR